MTSRKKTTSQPAYFEEKGAPLPPAVSKRRQSKIRGVGSGLKESGDYMMPV